MKIMCWLDSEDYWYMNSLSEQNKELNYYGYVMEVGDEDDTSRVKIMVLELQSAKLVVGFVVVSRHGHERTDGHGIYMPGENQQRHSSFVSAFERSKETELHRRRHPENRIRGSFS